MRMRMLTCQPSMHHDGLIIALHPDPQTQTAVLAQEPYLLDIIQCRASTSCQYKPWSLATAHWSWYRPGNAGTSERDHGGSCRGAMNKVYVIM
jgi:hypothetical protein